MQLFSLNRSCTFTDAQQEDFNVIIIAEHGGWLDVSAKKRGSNILEIVKKQIKDIKK